MFIGARAHAHVWNKCKSLAAFLNEFHEGC